MAKPLSCYLCGEGKFKKREGKVRDNPGLEIIECLSCGLVFLSSFDQISDNFYAESRIHEEPVDIQTLLKDTASDDERRFIFLRSFIENKSVLDFGCGAGGFLMRARAVAGSVVGVEVEARLKQHFKENGLKVFTDTGEISGSFEVITMFHVLEHVKDPIVILSRLAEKLDDNGNIIVEVPSADDALLRLYKNDNFSRFAYRGCHLFIFTNATISSVAQKAGLKVDYIKQIQRYPLSNHLYWLADGKPGGHKAWSFLDSPELHSAYERQLASLNLCDTIVASFSKDRASPKNRQ